MLVLSRRNGEKLRIGAEVEIQVLNVTRECVRLGVSAPRSISVYREEVHRQRMAGIRAGPPDAETRQAPSVV